VRGYGFGSGRNLLKKKGGGHADERTGEGTLWGGRCKDKEGKGQREWVCGEGTMALVEGVLLGLGFVNSTRRGSR